MISSSIKSFAPVAVLLALTLPALTGCGKGDDKKPATQVAAKVNSEEISVHQINGILAKTPGIPQELAPRARREILDKLVEQQLAVQQALEKKLDRTPEVMMAIESARREILARAYLDQMIKGLPKPTEDEARKYYAAHPELFAQRRIYRMQELAMPAAGAPVAQLRELVGAHKSMEDIAAALKKQNIRFGAKGETKPAEQIPMELLAKLHTLKDGQSVVVEAPQAVFVIRIVASQSAPVDEATALPRIYQFLANQQGGDYAKREMAQLKEKAKVEYLGEFATAAAEVKPAPPPVAKSEPPKPAVRSAAPSTSTVRAESSKPAVSEATVEKGVAGLK